jgi:putative nucleotidyltransferase with HDIG domain
MKKVIFVDDEKNVLNGYRRMLRKGLEGFEFIFASGGEQALTALQKNKIDVIVADIRMPGMDGVTLLRRVKQFYPTVVRIALTGHSDMVTSLHATLLVHQFLSKPCDAATLKTTLQRACTLSELLHDDDLQRLVLKLKSLPSPPFLYFQIMNEMQSPNSSTERVGKIVARDLAMTTKVLQLVNSAFFGLKEYVSDPVHATALLGMEVIRELVLSIHLFSEISQYKLEQLGLSSLWDHSLGVGTLARMIAQNGGLPRKVSDQAFLAGLLHDVGKLVLAENMPERYYKGYWMGIQEGIQLFEAEEKVFGANHAQLGAYLLALWGLPDWVVAATAYHHRPEAKIEDGFSPVTAVHIANVLDHETHPNKIKGGMPQVNLDYLDQLGLKDRLDFWRVKTGQPELVS